MTDCKKTVTGKHFFMPETVFNEQHNWFITFTRCQVCGMVDDKKKVETGQIKSRKPWEK